MLSYISKKVDGRNGMDYQKNARVFKALCDENRWKILDLLKNGEQCGCVLLNKLDISQSTFCLLYTSRCV